MKATPKIRKNKIDLSKMQQIYSSGDWKFEQENDGTYTIRHALLNGSLGMVYFDNLNRCAEVSFNPGALGVGLTCNDIHIIEVLLREMNANLEA